MRVLKDKPLDNDLPDIKALILMNEIFHYLLEPYLDKNSNIFPKLENILSKTFTANKREEVIDTFILNYSPLPLTSDTPAGDIEDLLLLKIMNSNPAAKKTGLFDDKVLKKQTVYLDMVKAVYNFLKGEKNIGYGGINIVDFLMIPALRSPDSLEEQLFFILKNWSEYLAEFKLKLLRMLDIYKESKKGGNPPGPGPSEVITFGGGYWEQGFSDDTHWMPNVVMIAKNTLVWLDQLSKKYGKNIHTLNDIPDEEIEILFQWGINTLWLIGIWQRSEASKKIKRLCGNPEAEASSYSLKNYEIAREIGGWEALHDLKSRCNKKGIRLASDMVPNHTGIDSDWIYSYPDRFIQLSYPPFNSYSFTGPDLSSNENAGLFIEDHYYDKTDAAVVFKYTDYESGKTRYIYHGNDGTSMPWNDTAQLDYSRADVREAVIREILHVAQNFPVIRFDAAMTLARKHIQRLWFPVPGTGGDIPSRAEHGCSNEDFFKMVPGEFWREVVMRISEELPDTLLLAEAFWMMEGYFVKNLGMHRVYNSAFMNMLKAEENSKYRQTIKNTLEFDPEILKRFVNFMNNPDEETAAVQFGRGDKYFGVCTMLAAMPGLPMIGHGQIEGFEEKYGMEYSKAYLIEIPDESLIERHRKEIFPLLKKRYLFSESKFFLLYDLVNPGGWTEENVFVWSNRHGNEFSLIAYNNSYREARGIVSNSVQKKEMGSSGLSKTHLADAMKLTADPDEYIYFTEQNSGLTFIRKGTELYEKGLYIELGGYKTQVFLDFTRVIDNDGSWRKLHSMLNGAGSNNLQDFRIIEFFLTEKRISLLKKILENTDRPINFAPLTDGLDLDLPILYRIQKNIAMIDLLFKESDWDDIEYFRRGFTIMPESYFLLLAWIILYDSEREYGYFPEQKIFLHCLPDPVFTENDRAKTADLLKIILDCVPLNSVSSRQVLKNILSLPQAESFMEINRWKDKTWYKREQFQTLTWWIYFLSSVVARDKAPQIKRLCITWTRAEEKSGCEVDKLLEYCQI